MSKRQTTHGMELLQTSPELIIVRVAKTEEEAEGSDGCWRKFHFMRTGSLPLLQDTWVTSRAVL